MSRRNIRRNWLCEMRTTASTPCCSAWKSQLVVVGVWFCWGALWHNTLAFNGWNRNFNSRAHSSFGELKRQQPAEIETAAIPLKQRMANWPECERRRMRRPNSSGWICVCCMHCIYIQYGFYEKYDMPQFPLFSCACHMPPLCMPFQHKYTAFIAAVLKNAANIFQFSPLNGRHFCNWFAHFVCIDQLHSAILIWLYNLRVRESELHCFGRSSFIFNWRLVAIACMP